MNWPSILLNLSFGFAFVGLVALILTAVRWATVADYVSDLWVKGIAVTIKFASYCISLLAAYSTTDDKPAWLPTAVAGGVCVVIWELLEKLVDSRIKAKDRIDKTVLDRTRRKYEALGRLLTAIRVIVNDKTKRLRRIQKKRKQAKPDVKVLQAGLTPADQILDVLQSLGGYFWNN